MQTDMIERCELHLKSTLQAPSTYRRVSADFGVPDPVEKKLHVIIEYDAVNAYNAPIRGHELCEFRYGTQEQKLWPIDEYEQKVRAGTQSEEDTHNASLGIAPKQPSCCMPTDNTFARSKEERTPWQSASRPQADRRKSDCDGLYVPASGTSDAERRGFSIDVQPSQIVLRFAGEKPELAEKKVLTDGSIEYRQSSKLISHLTCGGNTALLVMAPNQGRPEEMLVLTKAARRGSDVR